jgi:hypothetical protein
VIVRFVVWIVGLTVAQRENGCVGLEMMAG